MKITHVEDGGDRLVPNEVWVNLEAVQSISFYDKGILNGMSFIADIARVQNPKVRSPWLGKPLALIALVDNRHYITVMPSEIAALRKYLESAR